MSRFVKPEVVRLPISAGDFVDVKRRLNTAEHQEMLARMAPYQTPGQPVKMESIEVMRARVFAYLVGWSLTDDGRPVPYSPDVAESTRLSTLGALDPDTFREIRDAIDAHEDQEEARKNGQGGETASSNDSPLLATAIGATSGSAS